MTDEDNEALVIKEGIKQLFAPYADLINKLLGPAAEEVGLSWGDSMKVRRIKRQLRLIQEVMRMLEAADEEVRPIATRLSLPIIDAASIEDDDVMQTRWAALLANEALTPGSVHPSFVEVVKQLAPQDARLLDRLYDWCEERSTRTIEWWIVRDQDGKVEDQKSLQQLIRLGLVEPEYKISQENKQLRLVGTHAQVMSTAKLKEDYELSDFAVNFVLACRAPKAENRPQDKRTEDVAT